MKKILFIAFLLTSSLFASSIEWMDYDKALKLADKQGKSVMVMLGRDSCGACRYMKEVVFKDKNIITKFNKNHLAVYIELDFDEVPNDLKYFGTPTFYFLDKNEKTLERVDGGKTVPSFMRTLNKLN